jgi:hypothetical protein
MADTRRNLHQLLKGKQLYSGRYGEYREMLQDVTAVVKESAAEGGRAKTTITAPPSIEEFREQRNKSGNLETTPTEELRRTQYQLR